MLHHSILAFQDWPLWAEICGVSAEHYKDYHLDVPMDYHVEDGEHPVTRGLQDFLWWMRPMKWNPVHRIAMS